MTAELFSDAMGMIDDKYIMEAVSYHPQKHTVSYSWLYRVACLFLAIFLAASMFLSLNVEARAAFVQWINALSGDFYCYSFIGDNKAEPARYELGWIPEGYEYKRHSQDDDSAVYTYRNRDKTLSFLYLCSDGSKELWTNIGPHTRIQVSVNGMSGEIYLSENEWDGSSIIWTDKNMIFQISGYFDEDTLIKLAENVRIQEE